MTQPGQARWNKVEIPISRNQKVELGEVLLINSPQIE